MRLFVMAELLFFLTLMFCFVFVFFFFSGREARAFCRDKHKNKMLRNASYAYLKNMATE